MSFCVIIHVPEEIRQGYIARNLIPRQDGNRSAQGEMLWVARGTRNPNELLRTRETDGVYFYLDGCLWRDTWGSIYEHNNTQMVESFQTALLSYIGDEYTLEFSRFQRSRDFDLSSSLEEIPVFAVSNITAVENTPTISFLTQYQELRTSCRGFLSQEPENLKILIDKLDEYRELKGYTSLNVCSPSPIQNTLPLSDKRESLTMCIGAAATSEAGNKVKEILLPVSETGWVVSTTSGHSNISGRTLISINEDFPFIELGPHTVWILPKIHLLPISQFFYTLIFCLNALIVYEKNQFENFKKLYEREVKHAEIGIWEEAFVIIGPDVAEQSRFSLKTITQRITELNRKLEESYREKSHCDHILKYAELGELEWRKRGREQYQKLSKLPMVESCHFTGNEFKIVTKYIHMLHPETEKFYALGRIRFKFEAGHASESVRIKNLTHTFVGYWPDCAHPHVQQNTNGCLGTLGSSLAQLFGQGEYAEGIEQIIMFLQTVNLDDPAGAAIINWPLSQETFPDGEYNEGVKI